MSQNTSESKVVSKGWDSFNQKMKENDEKIISQSKENKKIKFLVLGNKAIGKEYVIRPVGDPVHFYKYVVQGEDKKWRSAITDNPESCVIKAKHNIVPKLVCAVNVINREDGEIYILEGTPTIFGEFRKFAEISQLDPGGVQGADFKITVTGKKGKDFYMTQFVKKSVLSEAEQKGLESNPIYPLEKIYKITPQSEIEKVLYGDQVEYEETNETKDTVAASSSEKESDDIPF